MTFGKLQSLSFYTSGSLLFLSRSLEMKKGEADQKKLVDGDKREGKGRKDGLFESAFKRGLVFVSSPLTHSWNCDLVLCCPSGARVSFSYSSSGALAADLPRWKGKSQKWARNLSLGTAAGRKGNVAGGPEEWHFRQYWFHSCWGLICCTHGSVASNYGESLGLLPDAVCSSRERKCYLLTLPGLLLLLQLSFPCLFNVS